MPVGTGTVVVALAVAVGAAFAFGGGDEGSGSREPWLKPIAPPQTPEELQAAKQTICACFRGGARAVDELAACALKQVYGGDAPWDELLTPVDGDHPTLAPVVALFRQLSAQLINLPEAQHLQWCGPGDGPVVIVDPPPPVFDKKQRIRELWSALKSDEPMPGRTYLLQKDVDSGGIEQLARRALENAGADIHAPGSYNKLIKPMMIALSRGPRWNRPLYARSATNDEGWYSYDDRNIKPAWLPRHQDANAAVISGVAPERNIFTDGKKKGPGTSYGAVHVPKFNVQIAIDDGVFVVDDDADYDPTAELLDLLGM